MDLTQQQLYAAVLAEPDADEPRLVYADYLDERGDPRGEFIRLQCELADLPAEDQRYGELRWREQQLLTKHARQWVKELPKIANFTWGIEYSAEPCQVASWTRRWFRRGFVEEGTFKHPKFTRDFDKVREHAPVRYLRFNAQPDNWREHLITSPDLAAIKGLDNLQTGFSQDDFAWFEKAPYFLEELDIHYYVTMDLRTAEVFDTQPFSRMNVLKCHPQYWVSTPIVGIISDKLAARLKEFEWSSDYWGRGQIANFFNRHNLPELRRLTFNNTNFNDGDLQAIIQSDGLPQLTHLTINAPRHGFDVSPLYKETPGFKHLRSLRLEHAIHKATDIQELANAPWVESLCELSLYGAKITNAIVKSLAASPHLNNLTHLDIRGTALRESAAKLLISSTGLQNLRKLAVNFVDVKEISSTTFDKLRKRFGKAKIHKAANSAEFTRDDV